MGDINKSGNVVVFITGYGPFANVKVNPSAAIAKNVAASLRRHPAVADVHADLELSVSIKVVNAFFDGLEKEVAKTIAEYGTGVKILLFHIGVHPDKTGLIRVEVQGYNELFASKPDVDGIVLNHEPIIPSDGPIERSLESWFGKQGTSQLTELANIVQALSASAAAAAAHDVPSSLHAHAVVSDHSKGGDLQMPAFSAPHWTVSRNAGRYLCNCALYRALRIQEEHPGVVYGIFIHVVDPTTGETENEVEDGRVVKYNPTIMTQSQGVSKLADALLSMMTA